MEKIPSSITLKASLENLDKVNRFVHQWSKKVGLSSQSEKDILLAVEEAYVNITKYAYPESTGRVTIYSRIDKDRLIIKIKDEGIPFNPLQFAKAIYPFLMSAVNFENLGKSGNIKNFLYIGLKTAQFNLTLFFF